MAFSKRRKKRRTKASKNSRIQEIRSPYSHRRSLAKKKLPKKSKKSTYSKNLKVNYKNKSPVKKWIILIGGVLLLIAIIYLTVFSNFFQLRSWKIYGDDIVQDNSKFEEFLKVHENKNLVFINTAEIENTIKSQYPEIQKLRIKKVFPETLVMEYENFPEVANLFNLIDGTQKKFIINEIGYLIEEDYENPNLPYIKLRTDKALEINNYAIDKDKLSYILDAIYDFEELFGMEILDAEYKKREREVHLKTERDFAIWLDTSLTLQEQYSKLKKVIDKLNIYTENLEYIDLRISSVNGDRVIFKRR
jgi:hypothetical protein